MRHKAPNLLDEAGTIGFNPSYQRNLDRMNHRQYQGVASIKGEQIVDKKPSQLTEDSTAIPAYVSVSSMHGAEPNFPVNTLMSKHLSQQ